MRASKGIDVHRRGKLVAFEGIDRAGKSSIVKLLPEYLADCIVPIRVCGELQSPLAPIIRDLLASGGSPLLKTFLFAADRAWTYEQVCLPALNRGELILWDRYVDSAIVYRAVELSIQPSEIIDLDFVRDINRIFAAADLTIYIDVSVETSHKRAKSARVHEPYVSSFLRLVRAEYLKYASDPANRYVIIDGERPLEDVVEETAKVIRTRFKEMFP